jgi:hypothetical protein
MAQRGKRSWSRRRPGAMLRSMCWRRARLELDRLKISENFAHPAVRKIFFSEEKKQKTFANWSRRCRQFRANVGKVFWFFFSKKNRFLA